MKTDNLPTYEYVIECLRYDADEGVLYWKRRPLNHFKDERIWSSWNAKLFNKKAGVLASNGYLYVAINNKKYLNHRVIMLLEMREWPTVVDHIDGNPLNNKIVNLRIVKKQQNSCNQKLRSNNITGVKGVYFRKKIGKYVAEIWVNYEHYLGSFESIDDAAYAYKKASEKYHGEYRRKK